MEHLDNLVSSVQKNGKKKKKVRLKQNNILKIMLPRCFFFLFCLKLFAIYSDWIHDTYLKLLYLENVRMYFQPVFQVLYFKYVFLLFWNETLHLPVLQDSLTSSCSDALNIIPILPVVQAMSVIGIFLSVSNPA